MPVWVFGTLEYIGVHQRGYRYVPPLYGVRVFHTLRLFDTLEYVDTDSNDLSSSA